MQDDTARRGQPLESGLLDQNHLGQTANPGQLPDLKNPPLLSCLIERAHLTQIWLLQQQAPPRRCFLSSSCSSALVTSDGAEGAVIASVDPIISEG